MSKGADAPKTGLRRGFRRPVRRDRAFWVGVGLAAIVVVAEFALSSPDTPLGWFAFVLIGAAVAVVIVTLVGIAVGTFRGFADGWRSARRSPTPKAAPAGSADQNAADPDDGPAASTDAPAEPLPPVVSDAAKKLAAAAGSIGSSVRKPTGADVDRTARALGRAASAAKRAYRKED